MPASLAVSNSEASKQLLRIICKTRIGARYYQNANGWGRTSPRTFCCLRHEKLTCAPLRVSTEVSRTLGGGPLVAKDVRPAWSGFFPTSVPPTHEGSGFVTPSILAPFRSRSDNGMHMYAIVSCFWPFRYVIRARFEPTKSSRSSSFASLCVRRSRRQGNL